MAVFGSGTIWKSPAWHGLAVETKNITLKPRGGSDACAEAMNLFVRCFVRPGTYHRVKALTSKITLNDGLGTYPVRNDKSSAQIPIRTRRATGSRRRLGNQCLICSADKAIQPWYLALLPWSAKISSRRTYQVVGAAFADVEAAALTDFSGACHLRELDRHAF